MAEKEKTIYELKLHEGLKFITNLGPIEVTRVPGGWVYCFDYPGFRQSQIVFVPLDRESKETMANAIVKVRVEDPKPKSKKK